MRTEADPSSRSGGERCRAPRLPELLLELSLPGADGQALAGDLNEEYTTFVLPERGRVRAALWYWSQVLRSLGPNLGRRYRNWRLELAERQPLRRRLMTSGLWQDTKLAFRSLRRQPGFAAVVVVTIGLGIGANVAIFSVLNPFLLRPLPYAEPGRLVHLFGTDRSYDGFGWNMQRFSHAEFADLRAQATSFDELAAYTYKEVNLTDPAGAGEPESVTGGSVSGELFRLLGADARIGRTLSPADAEPGSEPVLLLGDGLWRRRFGADPDVLGSRVDLDGTPHTVVGVMPADFVFPFGGVKLWTPLRIDATGEPRGVRRLLGVGRLEHGVGLDAANGELATVAARLEQTHPDTNTDRGLRATTLRAGLVFFFEVVRAGLLFLATAVGLILLIACLNIANLMLARAAGRQREVAMRSALGAGRGRIVRQLLVESGVLALLAGLFGVVIAVLAVEPVAATVPADLWRAGEITVDGGALAFALAVTLLTTLAFGLVPALRTTRADATTALKAGSSGAVGLEAGSRRLTGALVVAQMAGTLVLLFGAWQLIGAVRVMETLDAGFEPDGVMTASLALSRSAHPDRQALVGFWRELGEALPDLPGGAGAAVTPLPFNFESSARPFRVPGHAEPEDEPEMASAHWTTPGYFRAMQIPMLEGRDFTLADDEGAAPVVIVNRTLAETYWPGGSAVGRSLQLGTDESAEDAETATVVGVVADTVGGGLYEGFSPQIYRSLLAEPQRRAFLVARGASGAAAMAPVLRDAVWSLDPGQPVASVRSMDQVLDEALGPFRGMALLLTLLGAGGLILAVAGIYGVVSYSMSRRSRELGIRTALGASRSRVIRLVLAQGFVLTVVGVAIGLAIAVAVDALVPATVFGSAETPVLAWIALPLLLTSVALLAISIPALRATRIDPARVLRYE